MNKQKHIAEHKRMHKSLMILVNDWTQCGRVPQFERSPQRRTLASFIEWSEVQTRVPEQPVNNMKEAANLHTFKVK